MERLDSGKNEGKDGYWIRIKRRIRNLSLRKSFMYYALVFLFIGIVISFIVISVSLKVTEKIEELNMESVYYYDDVGDLIHETRTKKVSDFSTIHQMIYQFCMVLIVFSVPSAFGFSILAASILFYRDKLNEPISLLSKAVKKISDNDLDFKLDYPNRDEMGTLVGSFEKMRSSLESSNKELWRQIEERKKLNAAFSHDLRTPLTVLKGYVELIMKYYPQGKIDEEKLMNTLRAMNAQIDRLESYTVEMSAVQKMEDMVLKKTPIFPEELIQHLQDIADILCRDSDTECRVSSNTGAEAFWADETVIRRVFENLVSNSVRFAVKSINVTVDRKNSLLILVVSDDGCGFPKRVLQDPMAVYKDTAGRQNSLHFGLGLTICRILSQKHGGELILENTSRGSKATATFAVDSLQDKG